MPILELPERLSKVKLTFFCTNNYVDIIIINIIAFLIIKLNYNMIKKFFLVSSRKNYPTY